MLYAICKCYVFGHYFFDFQTRVTFDSMNAARPNDVHQDRYALGFQKSTVVEVLPPTASLSFWHFSIKYTLSSNFPNPEYFLAFFSSILMQIPGLLLYQSPTGWTLVFTCLHFGMIFYSFTLTVFL